MEGGLGLQVAGTEMSAPLSPRDPTALSWLHPNKRCDPGKVSHLSGLWFLSSLRWVRAEGNPGLAAAHQGVSGE